MSDIRIVALVEAFCRKFPQELANLGKLVTPVSAKAQADRTVLNLASAEAHRLSGAAGCMGFEQIRGLLHQLENDLDVPSGASTLDLEATSLRAARSWRAIDDISPGIRPERSTLITGPSPRRVDAVDETHASADTGAKFSLQGHRMLVVDDDLRVRSLVRAMLVDAGATDVALAASGAEALECLVSIQPTLIISDWKMPVMDGMQLLQRIRDGKTPAPKNTPIIFLTSQGKQLQVRSAILQGADGFVIKPFTQHSLMRAVRKVLHDTSMTGVSDASPRTASPGASTR